jgi:hypothetical protein
MRIAYVGNFSQPFCTEVHIAATLRDMGHTVVQLQENGIHPSRLIKQVEGSDLFLFTRTWGQLVNGDHLRQLRRLGIPSVSYHLDLYVGLKRDGGIDTDPFWRTDFVFTPDGSPEADAVFKAKGINHRFMWPAVFGREAYLVDAPIEHDLIFVGSWLGYHPEWPYRQQLVQWLAKNYGGRFEVWGPQGKGLVRGDELNKLYASTAITVGDSLCLDFKHERYVSDRLFEATGRGAFMIFPYIKGIEECFEIGTELVTYKFGDFKQLAGLIDYYYSHAAARERIRRAGHERTKRDHTYTNRLTQMLEVLRAEGAIR